MSAPITPALTAEEWARHLGRVYDISGELDTQSRPHALAALCLYGQPYGFTREDVTLLEKVINPLFGLSARDYENGQTVVVMSNESRDEQIGALRSLAFRIEALLPPEAL